jgi:hypothetical protein
MSEKRWARDMPPNQGERAEASCFRSLTVQAVSSTLRASCPELNRFSPRSRRSKKELA